MHACYHDHSFDNLNLNSSFGSQSQEINAIHIPKYKNVIFAFSATSLVIIPKGTEAHG